MTDTKHSCDSAKQQFEWKDIYRALHLGERRALLSQASRRETPTVEAKIVEQRLERWRALFSGAEAFKRRLSAESLNEETAFQLLEEPLGSLEMTSEKAPAWWQLLIHAFQEFGRLPHEALPQPNPPSPTPGSSDAFLSLVEPLVHSGRARLRDGLQQEVDRCPSPLLDLDAVEESLTANLIGRLRGIITRTLVLELQVARLEERLEGESPEARFRDFTERLRTPETALSVLASYPMLARRVTERVESWIEVSLEMVCRLRQDREEIQRRFFGREGSGLLVAVEDTLGDSHRGGRTVLELRFESGRKLVYKPKPLAADVAFQNLLNWINDKGLDPAFRVLEVLDRGAYGWAEFAYVAPCATPQEARRFYLRQGGFLALFYLLEATDFHHENVIAAGEHPVPVDLETLFHPPVKVPELLPYDQNFQAPMLDTVLRSGLLPQRLWGDDEHAGIDLSGLGAAGNQTSRPFWLPVDRGREEMRFEYRALEIPVSGNRPSLNGEDLCLSRFAGPIVTGFERACRLLMDHREELLSPMGPLASLDRAEVRVILRPTQAYAVLLAESLHPHCMSNAFERTLLFDRLWGGIEQRPFLERVVLAEIRDLERGDVPIFTSRPKSRDLWTSTGDRLSGFLGDTGWERMRLRLERLSRKELSRQKWLIRGAIQVWEHSHREPELPRHAARESPREATSRELLDAARAIGDRLFELSCRAAGKAGWWTIRQSGPRRWGLHPAGGDLYHGLPGIALFLAHLGVLSGEEKYSALAREATAHLSFQIETDSSGLADLGAFQGWGGAIYVLTQLGLLWNEPSFLDQSEELARDLPARYSKPGPDFLSGAAGGLSTLLELHRWRPAAAWLEICRRWGEEILSQGVEMESGMGWVVEEAGPQPLAGISHGAAGIVLSLLRLWEACGDRRFYTAALQGLAYERGLYCETARNWPDLRGGAKEMARRIEGTERYFGCFWCHGAPGVGLARVAGLNHMDDDEVRQEIAVAVETTLERGFGLNHSLCHGDLGNLEFLLEAANATCDEALRRRVYRLAGGILKGVEEHGWSCGQPLGHEPPGLMVGLAGIGHGLLRLAAPDRVPSILSLGALTHLAEKSVAERGV